MKLDLLKKLTALANNNPNENEANLAARKVCLMLAEAKFILPIEQPKATARPQSSHTGSGTWNDVKRSEEPEFKSTYYASNPSGPNPFEEFFKRYTENRPPYPTEPSQAERDEFARKVTGIFGDDPFTVSFDFADSFFGGRAGGGKTHRAKESVARNYNPIDDTIEVSCILCKYWTRVSKVSFEGVRACYVCPDCEGKSK